ncbi:MAG: DUF4062 domain-containing protein [candidate division KSB1 bacterium]|nr:DUF4062 domain-containing protein [candidate division KSB1 bacterium]MDZ7334821.1 DUF4062 domain-containing protein [candidate division KSB1 bacterium]MDZ7356549.1 DUF4062 domain-containing protein [candidate division KSB1 bacterium]MDZ7400450.1 DUF4062 domain-containing protein [candidate division KSB1 bacterium]
MKVFVSSTYEDLKEYREAVRDAIISRGYQPIMMEYFTPEGTEPPKPECLKRLREADIVVAIYAFRYGHIFEGDDKSITELEYELAVKKKKKIFFFMPHKDLARRWPKAFREENEKLREFRGKIQRDHYVQFFRSKDDLKFLVLKTLPHDLEIDLEKALNDARDETKNVPPQKQMEIIDQLIAANEEGRLSDEALAVSSRLITSNFKTFDSSLKLSLVHATNELLTGSLTVGDYEKIANRYTRWKQLKRKLRRVAGPALLFLLIGFFIGFLSYRYNWFNARVKYLAAKNTNPMDVVEWLAEEKVGENINFDDVASPGTLKAIIGLSFAYELDPKNQELRSNLERLLRDVRRDMRQRFTPPERLQNDLLVLNKIYEYVPYAGIRNVADSLKPRVDLIHLDQQWANPEVSDKTLLSGYQAVLRNYRNQIDAAGVQRKIDELSQSVARFEQIKAMQASDTVTITEQSKLWQDYIAGHRNSPERAFGQSEIDRIKGLMDEYASISVEDAFVVCRSVVDLNPIGKADHFPVGNVCAWAKVRAPRAEVVVFKWFANNSLYHTFNVKVDRNLEAGYRVHSAKNYGSEYRGRNEVRLYNSQNQLIGRRVFYVG